MGCLWNFLHEFVLMARPKNEFDINYKIESCASSDPLFLFKYLLVVAIVRGFNDAEMEVRKMLLKKKK